MAVDPLYTAVKVDFIAKLRLSNATKADTLAVIDTAISEVRLGFFKELTQARAITIQGFTSTDNPLTDNEILKSTAAIAEANWVTAILIRLLPQMFMEGQATARQSWNEEPLTRDAGDLEHFRNSLLSSVNVALGQLLVPVDEDNRGPVKVADIGRETPFIIGQSGPGLGY